MKEFLKINLYLFDDANFNATTDDGTTQSNDLSPEMKTYYSDYLIDLAEPLLIHDQFGQKQPIPKNGGKTIEFRKYAPLDKALTPLTEGVTPAGQKMNVSTVTATVAQYGGYIELTDLLLLTAIDNNQVQAAKLIASQAGRTLDTVTREILAAGTNVQYGDGSDATKTRTTLTATDVLTPYAIKRAVRTLKIMNTPKINGDYVAIIHPDCAFDLTESDDWKYPHQYVDTENIYSGEIGKIAGCRFVETTEAKVIDATTAGNTAGKDVYCTLVLGADAYGVTEVTGGGLEYIAKQLGSAGTADALNQRSTVGWKATKTAEILVNEYMIRIETCSTFDVGSN